MLFSDVLSRICFECRSSLRRLRRNEAGATAIMTALALTVLMGFVGLGTEVGMWYAERRAMQNASDAAAMGAAFEIYENGKDAPDGDVEAAGKADSKLNGFEDGLNEVTVTVNRPPQSGELTEDDTAVETILTKKRATLFGALFMGDEVNIKVRSVATVDVKGVYCILALAPTKQGALTFTGTADVGLKNCGINVNSNHPTGALTATGASVVGATYADVVGGIDEKGNALLNIPDIQEGADAVDDPYGNLDVPTGSGCDHTKFVVKKGPKQTLYPGRYCNGLKIESGASANMTAGRYFIVGGELNVQGDLTTDTTDGVTIFLTGNSTDGYATVKMNAQSNISITATITEDDPYRGIAIFQDRNAPIVDTGTPNQFNGGSLLHITGAIYIPNQLVVYNGGNKTNGACTRIVAFMISFAGESGLNTDCGYGFGTPQIYPPVLAE